MSDGAWTSQPSTPSIARQAAQFSRLRLGVLRIGYAPDSTPPV
jgi:hypothetical protein